MTRLAAGEPLLQQRGLRVFVSARRLSFIIEAIERRYLFSAASESVAALAAPTDLKAERHGYDLSMSWKDNSNGETGFEIWEKVNIWFVTNKTVPANTTSI